MRLAAVTAVVVVISILPSIVRAQAEFDPLAPPTDFGSGIIGQFDDSSQFSGEPLTVDTHIVPASAERPAVLVLQARVAPGRHTYSLTQPPGGPNPTRIELAPSNDYRLLAPLRAYPEPEKHIEQGPVWTGLEIQEHKGDVTWYAPIEITAGVDAQTLEIHGSIRADVCETGGSCVPVQKEFAAPIVAGSELGFPIVWRGVKDDPALQAVSQGTFQAKDSVVQLTGHLEPARVRPGETASLVITATVPESWHVYAYSPRDNKRGSKPTLIALSTTSGLVPHRPTTDAAIKVDSSVPVFGPMQYHEGPVTWTTQLDVPANAPPGEYRIAGVVGYQACQYSPQGGSCELAQAASFTGSLQVGDGDTAAGSSPLSFSPADNFKEAATLAAVFADHLDRQDPSSKSAAAAPPATGARDAADAQAIAKEATRAAVPGMRATDAYDLEQIRVEVARGTLGYYLALAFVGGLILNLMPCVLPVIGLKVMSFVEQAGRSRTHALVLNLWYAAGIVSVFLLLGILAATINLGWGGQFGSTAFNVAIAAVVFAMALSLLGVWEVPIPGFFGSGSVQAAAAKEGPLGAFLKGVVTTILATPCTAPFMASAVAWAVAQPVAQSLAVFATLGLGMASPYVLVGVYPELLRFLPKPGAWMETFKQISGFVLLGTVVFILSFLEQTAVVPTIALLLGIGVACWVLSRTPMTADFSDRLRSWAKAAAVLLVFIGVSFGIIYRIASAPPADAWQPFSLERLKQLAVDEGRTVLVDFSAEWCINCKLFEKTVLHTEPVKQAIEKSGAVTMYADYTDYPEEIERTLKALRASGVPVIAVFPGKSPYQPIVFRGGYTQRDLITALQSAEQGFGAGTNNTVAAAVMK